MLDRRSEWGIKAKGEKVVPRPRRLLQLDPKYKGFGFACPWCGRGVIRTKGLQHCAVCGGIVDNDITEPAPEKLKLKSDRKTSWR